MTSIDPCPGFQGRDIFDIEYLRKDKDKDKAIVTIEHE